MVFCDLPLLLVGLAGVDDDELFTFSLDSLDDRNSVACRRRLIRGKIVCWLSIRHL